ncbi:MAG TPA: RHS repeat-associated core domain-containing protein [Polyangiaceae bacterium]|jgi:RHS repeat-associated protein
MNARQTRALLLLLSAASVTACSGRTTEPLTASVIQAASVSGEYDYSFDPAGLVTSVGTSGASYAVARAGDTLTAGADTYRFDALGRVRSIDDLAIAYGPDGQIDHATHGADTVSYLHDELGHRLLKSKNGQPVMAYVDDATITESELVEPVHVNGKLVGVLRNGTFALTATDTRDTVLGDTTGTQRLPSPFGARPVHPDVAPSSDYIGKGFDADLGADRLSVRDYDARIARFLEPDPLFLAHPDKCVESPAECNLYGYGRGDPVDYVDPKGTHSSVNAWPFADPVHQFAVVAVLQGRVTDEQLTVLVQQQEEMDRHQRPEDQPMHAMNGKGQDRMKSIETANKFVAQELTLAREYFDQTGIGFVDLGRAIHTLQDSTSPAHAPFQTFKGGFWGTITHVIKENYYPAKGDSHRQMLEGVTRWAYDIAAGKAPMPDRFFDGKTGEVLLPDRYKTTEGSGAADRSMGGQR